MLKETIKLMQDFASEYNSTTDKYNSDREHIKRNYIGDLLGEKEVALAGEYNTAIATIREKYIAEIKNIISEQKNTTQNELKQAMPEEFTKALDVYRGVEIDKSELEIIINQYGQYYFASKEIKKLAEKNNIPCKFISVSDKLEELDKLFARAKDVIHTYKGKNNSYMHELFLTGSDINAVSEYIGKSIELR